MSEKRKTISENKKAYHEYNILDTLQAGLVLHGTEVKSLRVGKCSINESYIQIRNNEAFILNMHISPYVHGNRENQDPARTRKLLLHKKEIRELENRVAQDGHTIIPLRVYFSKGKAKIDIALAKGKKLYDKRDSIAKKDHERDIERAFRERNR